MIGGVVLARAVQDSQLSDEILKSVRQKLVPWRIPRSVAALVIGKQTKFVDRRLPGSNRHTYDLAR